jgi:outer membrane protein assembly factor BamB
MKRRLRPLPAVAAILILAVAPAASAANFPATIPLDGALFQRPEGITTGAGNRIYVGSLANGAIWAGNARTGNGAVINAGEAGRAAAGMDYEDRSGRLWVAGAGTRTVHAFDGRTGALLRSYTLPAATPVGFLNDVVVTRSAVYVTDSNVKQLIVIPLPANGALPEANAITTMALTGAIVYTTGFNANGIVAARGWLIVVQTNEGKLFRVNPSTGETVEITRNTTGFSDAAATIRTGDGLELRGSTLYVVRNNVDSSSSEAVLVHRLGAGLTSARLLGILTSPSLDVSTTATLAAGRLWVVNARFTTPVTPDTDWSITRLPARP